jgi:ribosomal protein L33
MAHLGPIQQYTEVCLACGQNVYDTDVCKAKKPKKVEKRKDDNWGDF